MLFRSFKKGSFFNFLKFKIIPETFPSTAKHKFDAKLLLENLKVIRIVPEIKISRTAKRACLIFVSSLAASYLAYNQFLKPKESRFRRKLFTFATVATILADYKWTLFGAHLLSEDESLQQKLSTLHTRSAKRLLKLANSNGGIYIKAGQFITSLNGIPIEYRRELCSLENEATPCTFNDIKSVILGEFPNKTLDDLFLFFEERPMAAASLAQVHRAITRNGEPVAVKVQYPLTERCFNSDLGNLSLSSRIVHWVFPQIDLDWIIRRFKNEIQKELNFVQEAQNSQEIASLFSKRTSLLKIPSIHWDLTTRRVLTMELIEGVKITDVAALRAIGINPRQVVRSLYEVFGEMIFCHGFFHADPHPGNIMVQPQSNGPLNFRIVLLDHGLYRRLSPAFRQDFCQLWKALIPFNDERLFSICKKMGVETHYRYFPLLISRSYWRSLKLVSLRELASLEVFRLVENASEDLMLVIKSFVHLHYIASDLGVNSFEVARVLAKFAFKGEAFWGPEAEARSSVSKYFQFYSRYILFKLAIAQSMFFEAIGNLYYRLLSIEII